MLNHIICSDMFSARCTALMCGHGPISAAISICIARHRIVNFPVAHGTSVPIFKESQPLS